MQVGLSGANDNCDDDDDDGEFCMCIDVLLCHRCWRLITIAAAIAPVILQQNGIFYCKTSRWQKAGFC